MRYHFYTAGNGITISLEESFVLELGNPRLDAVLRHIVLVVFVAHKSAELVVVDGLGFDVVVSVLAGHTENLGTLGGEEIVKLSGGITVVVTVRLLVAHTEDGDLLSINIEVGEGIVEPVIPRGSRSLLISTSVPSRGTDDKAVSSGDGGIFGITDVLGFSTDGISDVSGNGFGVSGGGGVVKSNRVEGGGGRGSVHGRSEGFSGGQEGGNEDCVLGKHFDDF